MLALRSTRTSQAGALRANRGNPLGRGTEILVIGCKPGDRKNGGASIPTRFGTYQLLGDGFLPDGVTGYATYPLTADDLSNMTVLTVATPKVAPASGYAGIALAGFNSDDPSRPTSRVCFGSDSKIYGVFNSSSGSVVTAGSAGTFLNTKVVGVVTRTGNTGSLYVNGIFVGSATMGGNAADQGGAKILMLGRNGQAFSYTYFNGLIEVTAVWPYVLSAAEIAQASRNALALAL